MTKVRDLAVTYFLVAAVAPSWAAAHEPITDADTVVLNDTPYRLDGVDAPETDQICLGPTGALWTCGIEARNRLRSFVRGRWVHCDDKGPDPAFPNRRIGLCWVAGETVSISQWLVREGLAINYEPYAKGRFKADQDRARRGNLGLWRGCFSKPQDLRGWDKKRAVLLGAACPRENDGAARDLLFPDHPAMPPGCAIKAKRRSITGHQGIYHLEGCKSYRRLTKPDRWFCSELEAQAEGFRKARNCPERGGRQR